MRDHVLRQFPEIERFEIITKYSSEQIINRSQNIQHLIDEIPGCSRSVLIHDRYSAVKDAKFIKLSNCYTRAKRWVRLKNLECLCIHLKNLILH